MIVNHQESVTVNLGALRLFVKRLRAALYLEGRHFNVCLVDDAEIRRLNARFRGRRMATDVLSFPWDTSLGASLEADTHPPSPRKIRRKGQPQKTKPRKYRIEPRVPNPESSRSAVPSPFAGHGLEGFLGDIVISAETARRNASAEGHPAQQEMRWLILHGVLHLLGYDHETDRGEMVALELALRDRLGIAGTH